MKKTFEVINALQQSGIIQDYAMGGATALLFYSEPALTLMQKWENYFEK